ncbi:1-deoxy-D-xylulose 5-phosphate reductoisomerase [Halopolyspora algeriensis]|uniref:1-deoxy-D-xylulose 5-phosphate reductoisomerase n=1 Tax=Halopolyspora algeriensis TaxID=1500506 RepID=A0A368VFH7_9ACTN|nr:1-deoxy-D-xylulose-5-phosphate reductoisomerase [Halopolyspora algeriensis]RCW39822.1 1-deoxy-D-xylulose 5-phosphate reductoisomerase [Halopolyspora algeriensis]TQM56477.1 1-deoxy-D-xylulose 5-phosphate reductoisomerase [Halopolyspora algeriensis]
MLGSTGSIGTQALDVIRRNPKRFRVLGLAAGGGNPHALAAQALEFGAEVVAVARGTAVEDLQLALYAEAQRLGYATGEFRLPRLLGGPRASTEIVEATGADVVLNGMDGSLGLRPTLAALDAGSQLALANKESLVAGGPLVLRKAQRGQIVPVDSEHSALAQCLLGGRADEVDRLVLTASGGPFRGRTREELAEVTLEQALAHPTWSMGTVVTINSATMVNKSLELIEAHLLFGVEYDRIDVVVHPQSIVHSMVTFVDGSTIAQASPPDMRLPIALGLDWPNRLAETAPRLTFDEASTWTFEPLDDEAFPAVALARHAGRTGGCLPAIYNAANEEAVAAFVQANTGFTSIVQTVERVLAAADEWSSQPGSVDEVFEAEEWARVKSRELVGTGRVH